MLFALLLACVGVMKADVTKFYKPGERVATLTAGQQVMFYNTTLVLNNEGTAISQDRTGFLVDNGSSLGLSKTKPSQNPVFSEKVGVWTIETVEDNTTYYKVSVKGSNGYVGIGGVTNNTDVRDLYFHKWTEVAAEKKAGVASENAAGETVNSENITASNNVWLVANGDPDNISTTWNGNTNSFATWSTGHPYAMYSVVEAETTDLEALLATAKSDALTVLESLAKLTISTVATAITEVNAVVLENNDLEAALNTIDGLVLEAKKSMDGKSLVFDNNGNSGRAGLSVTANKSVNRAYGTTSEADDIIWTIKSQDNGSFKLYSFVADRYLGAPGSNDNSAVLADEAGAAAYEFIVTDANKVALVSDGKMLHQRTVWSPNYDLINWYDLNDEASLWTITEKDITVSREQYDLAAAAASSLPYAIQQAYGLVTDAANYYSNYKSEAEGSYEALLDNEITSFFHSAYGSEPGDGSNVHYIQADLGEGNSVDEFYFYMAPRNANNRPVDITVSGSNDNTTYTEIATVKTTLASASSYMSAKLGTDGTNYRYIRLKVTSTNTSTTFFTLSELYFFPADGDAGSLIESYHAFAATSITDDAMVDVATALINAETTLALSNIKKEVAALLAANEENHAETPALGQYTTEAYNALNTAYNAADATQESLEEAIAAFEASQNAPVYVISGVYDYANGKAIYYNGSNPEWRWDTKNVYNKAMWFKIPGLTSSDFATNTDYNIVDFDGRDICNRASVKIQTIDGWDNVYNLQYGTGSSDYIHAANHSNNLMTNWYAATTADNKASAWQVEYIGNSYDLAKLTEEYLAKGTALKDAYNNVPAYNIAAGVNNYSEPVAGRLADAKAAALASLGKLDTEDNIAAAKAELEAAVAVLTINMPENGKFYRVRCTDGNRRILSTLNADGSRLTLANTVTDESIYCYTDGALLSYTTGLYMNAYNFNAVGASTAVTIQAAHTGTVGCYNIKVGDRWIYGAGETIDSGTGDNPDNRAGYRWWFEEVTTLPVVVSAAGYATLYAPVALTIPAEGVTVYTATVEDGYLALTEVEGAIPANTGVIIEAAEDTYNFAVAAEAAAVESDLVGAYAKSVKNADAKVYTLQKPAEKEVGFYLFNGQDANSNKTYINGFRAWVEVANGEAAPAMFSLGRGEGTTSIDNVQLTNDNVVIYDLSGRRVEKMEKGIYIVNGKKVIR